MSSETATRHDSNDGAQESNGFLSCVLVHVLSVCVLDGLYYNLAGLPKLSCRALGLIGPTPASHSADSALNLAGLDISYADAKKRIGCRKLVELFSQRR